MKLTPLTKEQQALCVQWRPLAIRYALLSMRKHGVESHSDEAEGIANEALVSASRVWDPKRAGFAACLKVWVFARVRLYRTQRYQPMSRPREQWENVVMFRETTVK